MLEITRKFLLTGVSTLLRGGTYSQLLLKIVSVGFALTALVPSALSAVDPYAAREVGSG